MRETLWLGVDFSIDTIAAPPGPIFLGALNATALALRPFTVVRSRGELYLTSDQEAAAENQQAAFGIAVVSDQASSIGITALPTPFVDSNSDLWLVYQIMNNRTVANPVANVGTRYQFDSKAMRKVEDGQDLVSVVEASTQGNGLFVFSATRHLLKLH